MKVVCFDLGGVLVRITLNVAEAGRRAGIEGLPDESFGDLKLLLGYQAGTLDTPSYLAGLAKYLKLTTEQAQAVHNHILIGPYSGTFELIQELNRDLKTACLSNTNDLHWQEMLTSARFPNVQALGLQVASHLVHLEKPDAAIFAAFEALSGATGDDIVFFDDTSVNVDAATELGWRAHKIDRLGDPTAQMRRFLLL